MNNYSFLKELLPLVEKCIIKSDQKYNLPEGYETFKEVITLYAKQHNLVESTLLLLDNNMNEEAIILARSALNNYFLIGYLLNDDDKKSHLTNYKLQPTIAELKYWKHVKKMFDKGSIDRLEKSNKKPSFTKENVDENINKYKDLIKNSSSTFLSIYDIAEKSDIQGLDIYITSYLPASKFEHSEKSTLSIYQEPSPNDQFTITTSRTDESLKNKIIPMIFTAYIDSLYKILNESILKNQNIFKEIYDMELFAELMYKIEKSDFFKQYSNTKYLDK